MKFKKDKWVKISVFYDASKFHLLIRNAIIPLVDYLTDNSIIDGYFFSFSSERGSHIKLSLRCLDTKDIEICVERYLGTYCHDYPSQRTESIIKAPSLFMDFPNNKYFYSLYDDLILKKDLILINCKCYISKAVMRTLYLNPINPEEVLTVLLYLQLGLVKSLYPTKDSSTFKFYQLRDYLGSTSRDYLSQSNDVLEAKLLDIFNDCQEVIIQMASEVWTEEFSGEMKWLDDWISDCATLNISSRQFNQLFAEATKIIFEVLGFSVLNVKVVTFRLISIIVESQVNLA